MRVCISRTDIVVKGDCNPSSLLEHPAQSPRVALRGVLRAQDRRSALDGYHLACFLRSCLKSAHVAFGLDLASKTRYDQYINCASKPLRISRFFLSLRTAGAIFKNTSFPHLTVSQIMCSLRFHGGVVRRPHIAVFSHSWNRRFLYRPGVPKA